MASPSTAVPLPGSNVNLYVGNDNYALGVQLAQAGRRCNVNDLWIAATAASRGLAVVTQDDDFGPVEGVGGLQVVRV